MSTVPPLGYSLSFALKRAQHAFRTRVDMMLRPIGLTAPQHATLAAIDADAGLSNAALARLAFVTPQTMQGILSNMARDGLLIRVPDPLNRRVLQTELTAKGVAAVEQSRRIVAEIERRLFDAVGDQHIDQLIAMLATCADSLSSEITGRE